MSLAGFGTWARGPNGEGAVRVVILHVPCDGEDALIVIRRALGEACRQRRDRGLGIQAGRDAIEVLFAGALPGDIAGAQDNKRQVGEWRGLEGLGAPGRRAVKSKADAAIEGRHRDAFRGVVTDELRVGADHEGPACHGESRREEMAREGELLGRRGVLARHNQADGAAGARGADRDVERAFLAGVLGIARVGDESRLQDLR
jgi:hypothetical protein